jgi:hypothetical protein
MKRVRLRNHYTFDIDRGVDAARRFNSSVTMAASEHLLAQHFSGVEAALDPATIAERVVLLDGLWATQLFREPGASDRIVRSLESKAPSLAKLLKSLGADVLETDPDSVVRAAEIAMPAILSHSPDSTERHRRFYSFASKFLHWVTRHHFPIVDSRARERINEVQRAHNVKNRVRSAVAAMNGLAYEDEYPRWIHFYSDLVADLAPNERESLLRADFDSQFPSYRIKNSLLRVLDKVFYAQGGGSGLGRFELVAEVAGLK